MLFDKRWRCVTKVQVQEATFSILYLHLGYAAPPFIEQHRNKILIYFLMSFVIFAFCACLHKETSDDFLPSFTFPRQPNQKSNYEISEETAYDCLSIENATPFTLSIPLAKNYFYE
ncbi:hypothetical protein T08_3679 [Trichinella sp. T8]|nr:hypothetical protein T08_3679 [Trichinella sp. T8]